MSLVADMHHAHEERRQRLGFAPPVEPVVPAATIAAKSKAGRRVWQWSYIVDLRLTRLWAAGFSFGRIAEMLGHDFTRNAIAGRVRLLKLPSRKTEHTLRELWPHD